MFLTQILFSKLFNLLSSSYGTAAVFVCLFFQIYKDLNSHMFPNQVCALYTCVSSPDGGVPGLHKRNSKTPKDLLA